MTSFQNQERGYGVFLSHKMTPARMWSFIALIICGPAKIKFLQAFAAICRVFTPKQAMLVSHEQRNWYTTLEQTACSVFVFS